MSVIHLGGSTERAGSCTCPSCVLRTNVRGCAHIHEAGVAGSFEITRLVRRRGGGEASKVWGCRALCGQGRGNGSELVRESVHCNDILKRETASLDQTGIVEGVEKDARTLVAVAPNCTRLSVHRRYVCR